jgi:hypothetical protein
MSFFRSRSLVRGHNHLPTERLANFASGKVLPFILRQLNSCCGRSDRIHKPSSPWMVSSSAWYRVYLPAMDKVLTWPFQVTCVAGIVSISDHGSMRTYYLEDGSAGRLRTTCFQESETSRHPLEYVEISVCPDSKALDTDGVLKGRTTTCV